MPNNGPLIAGEVIHIPGTGPAHDKSRGHFFVVITEADDEDKVILTPISSYHEKCDKTCVLSGGTHPKVVHDSFMLYALTKYYSQTHIIGKIALHEMQRHAPIDEIAFLEIRSGLLKSSLSPRIYQKRLKSLDDANVADNLPTDETQAR